MGKVRDFVSGLHPARGAGQCFKHSGLVGTVKTRRKYAKFEIWERRGRNRVERGLHPCAQGSVRKPRKGAGGNIERDSFRGLVRAPEAVCQNGNAALDRHRGDHAGRFARFVQPVRREGGFGVRSEDQCCNEHVRFGHIDAEDSPAGDFGVQILARRLAADQFVTGSIFQQGIGRNGQLGRIGGHICKRQRPGPASDLSGRYRQAFHGHAKAGRCGLHQHGPRARPQLAQRRVIAGHGHGVGGQLAARGGVGKRGIGPRQQHGQPRPVAIEFLGNDPRQRFLRALPHFRRRNHQRHHAIGGNGQHRAEVGGIACNCAGFRQRCCRSTQQQPARANAQRGQHAATTEVHAEVCKAVGIAHLRAFTGRSRATRKPKIHVTRSSGSRPRQDVRLRNGALIQLPPRTARRGHSPLTS